MTDPVPGLLSQYDISPEEKQAIQKQNFWGALMQTGMGLMAAGSPVSDAQRAQLLMQSAQPFANMGAMNQAMMQSASREKLNMAAAQRLAQQDQAAADIRKMADDPSFQESLGVLNPAMRAIIQADLKLGKTDSARAFLTPSRTEVPSGYRVAGDGLEAIPGGPADPAYIQQINDIKKQADMKPLGNSNRDDLLKAANPAIGLVRLTETFKPEYAGYKVGAGEAWNWVGRNIGGSKETQDQAQWWQDYQDWTNLKRNSLFGSALTPGETSEYNKAMVHPGMTPDQVQRNLSRQMEIGLNATRRLAESMLADGIKKESIEAALGMKIEDLRNGAGQSKPPSPGGITKEQYDALPSGAEFIAPDGNKRRKP